MALPDITKFSSLQLLILIEDVDLIKTLLDNNRIAEGRAVDAPPSAEEYAFLCTLSWGLVIRQALAETKPVDFLNLWGKKTGKLRGKGRPTRAIYRAAWLYHDIYGVKLMEVYRTLVLPHFLQTGEVKKKKDGQPDPTQDIEAQEDFFKAMDGFRKTSSK